MSLFTDNRRIQFCLPMLKRTFDGFILITSSFVNMPDDEIIICFKMKILLFSSGFYVKNRKI